MAARRKTLSASKVLFAGPSPVTGAHPVSSIKELYGLQDFSVTYSNNSENIQALGQLAPIGRDSLEQPTAEFNFSYLLSNFDNEGHVGLVVNGQSGAFSKILNGQEDEKNYFMVVAAEGSDAIGANPASTPCIGWGNAALGSYGFNATVGDYPTVSLNFLALNAKSYADSTSELTPNIDTSTGLENTTQTFTLPTASGNARFGRNPVLKPGDITVNLANATGLFYNVSQACITSVSIDVDLGREPQECLGNRYARARDITYPIDVNFSFEFQAPDLVTGSMNSFFCQTGLYSGLVSARLPACNGATGASAISYDLRGLRWVSQDESVGLGNDGTSVTVNMVGSIGSATDANNNLILSGIYNP